MVGGLILLCAGVVRVVCINGIAGIAGIAIVRIVVGVLRLWLGSNGAVGDGFRRSFSIAVALVRRVRNGIVSWLMISVNAAGRTDHWVEKLTRLQRPLSCQNHRTGNV